jgi:cytochrome c-type biogenesis protein CcmH
MILLKKSALILLVQPIVLVIVLVAFAGIAQAQQPTPANLEDETLRVAKGLFCPVCPSTPLDVCETQACVQWRALIREKLAAGQSEEQIRAYFVDQYGERVLGAPRPEGFNLGIYILPPLAVAGGILILFFTIRSWVRSRAAAQTAAPTETVAPELADRIAREMKERE